MLPSRLKTIVRISLVSAWLLASVAPGLLALLSAGSRTLLAAAGSAHEISAVTLALLRGELCGFAIETESDGTDRSKPQPAAESSPAKIILCLIDGEESLTVPSRPGTPASLVLLAVGLDPPAPPGPPPKVI